MNDNLQARLEVGQFLKNMIKASRLDLRFDFESKVDSTSTLTVRFHGPDVSMLTDKDANLLKAISHLLSESYGFSEATLDSVSITLASNGPISEADHLAY